MGISNSEFSTFGLLITFTDYYRALFCDSQFEEDVCLMASDTKIVITRDRFKDAATTPR